LFDAIIWDGGYQGYLYMFVENKPPKHQYSTSLHGHGVITQKEDIHDLNHYRSEDLKSRIE